MVLIHLQVEEGNLPENGSIFPDSPTDVAPVYDYTAAGAKQSYLDSMRRILGTKSFAHAYACTVIARRGMVH